MSGNRVYSTDQGRICPSCNKAVASCRCKPSSKSKSSSSNKSFSNKQDKRSQQVSLPNDGIIRLARETKGRKGAGVTLIHGLNKDEKELKAIAKSLKAHCGCGGAIKDGVVEIQGDQREKIKAWLEKKEFTVKLAGG